MATDLSSIRPEDDAQVHSNITNGDEPAMRSDNTDVAANQGSFLENGTLPTKETTINTKAAPDPNPAGPTPTQDVADGIQPVADFIPKDAPNLSHPTPPPDEQLGDGEADVDTEMANATESDAQLPAQTEAQPEIAAPPPAEPSLVRPREDDGEDEERAAKRSRVEEDLQVPPTAPEIPAGGPADAGEGTGEPAGSELQASGEAMQTEPSAPAPVESTPESAPAPAPAGIAESAAPEDAKPAVPEIDAVKSEETAAPPAVPSGETDAKPSIEGGVAAPAAAVPEAGAMYSTAPMTALQQSTLEAKMKNLKKTKSSIWFTKPVDHVALNIPQYPEIIKNPMDLGTMESKLKSRQYQSVQDFANDFDLIVANARKFNGDQHPVTHAVMALDAYFRKAMEGVPSADQKAPEPAPKRGSPAVKSSSRRESRNVPVAPAGSETFALQADGVPLIRRDSNLHSRPARAIKPPANREIPYAKPKRKEHQLELKFCEYALDEIKSHKYAQVNTIFLAPVDPVALNIPHYRQVIKHPMDLSTMGQKLKQGQYAVAKEFRKDFDLMIENCLLFNPQGNPVRDMGIQLRRHFDELWKQKEKWEKAHKPESQRGTSDDEDEDAEDEDEDDDEPELDKEEQIRALQKQLADMQNTLGAMTGAKSAAAKSKKSKSKGTKKISSVSSNVPKSIAKMPQAKSKKASRPKQVTYDEKQEISEAVGRMNQGQVEELTKIITENVPKYRDQEEMELEIDDLPNDVQGMLLKFVRRLFGKPKSAAVYADSPPDAGEVEDDDFEPERGARGGGKRKKHKPMGKREQAETIDTLHKKLAQFGQVATSGSESPTASSYNAGNAHAETSGDDESESSEEE